MSSIKYIIKKSDEDFIKANYRQMHDAEIGAELNLRPYYVLQFRKENGLVKKEPVGLKRFEPGNIRDSAKLFNVNSVTNWVA